MPRNRNLFIHLILSIWEAFVTAAKQNSRWNPQKRQISHNTCFPSFLKDKLDYLRPQPPPFWGYWNPLKWLGLMGTVAHTSNPSEAGGWIISSRPAWAIQWERQCPKRKKWKDLGIELSGRVIQGSIPNSSKKKIIIIIRAFHSICHNSFFVILDMSLQFNGVSFGKENLKQGWIILPIYWYSTFLSCEFFFI